MISWLEGEIIHLLDQALVIKVGGVGLKVFVPAAVRISQRINDRVALFTTLVVREDSLSIYGFGSEEERDFFELLLGVSGIGPRTALNLLSTLSVETIRRAVLSEQAEIFGRVPGVGKKTGQKIILYLQGKIKGDFETGAAASDVDGEVLEALTGLGYSVVEAQAALQSIPRETPQDVEERLRQALRYFSI